MGISKNYKRTRLILFYTISFVVGIILPQSIFKIIINNPKPESIRIYEEWIYLFDWTFNTWLWVIIISQGALIIFFTLLLYRSKILREYLLGEPLSIIKSRIIEVLKKGRNQYLALILWIKKYAIFQVIGIITALIAVSTYYMDVQNNRKQKHLQPWQVIYQAEGKKSHVGRIQALKDLQEDNVSLQGIDL